MNSIEKAIEEFQAAIKRWYPDAREMSKREVTKRYTQDRKDMKKVLGLVKKGKMHQAYELACSLDTIVREEIPNSIWTIISKESW